MPVRIAADDYIFLEENVGHSPVPYMSWLDADRKADPCQGEKKMPSDATRGDPEAGDRLVKAIIEGDRAGVVAMLDSGVNVHQVDLIGQSPMFVAARNGKADIITLLLHRGVDVNAPVQAGRGPLYHAASNARPDAVRTLIENGADVNAIDGYGQTPLLAAASQLANEKLNVREPKVWRDRQQRDPQGVAAVVETLLEAGADVDYSKGGDYYSARHFILDVDIPRLTALMRVRTSSGSRGSFWSTLFGRR